MSVHFAYAHRPTTTAKHAPDDRDVTELEQQKTGECVVIAVGQIGLLLRRPSARVHVTR